MKLSTTLLALAVSLPFATTAQAQTRIGNDPAGISRALASFGFAPQFRIIDREIVRTVVEACRGRDMFRVSVNVLGAVKTKERRGRCDIPGAVRVAEPEREPRRAALTPRQVRQKLRDEGFSQIRFTDRELPRYVATACDRRARSVELVLNRRGEVRRRNVIGDCERRRPITAASLEEQLANDGFTRIRIENERAPFGVVACRNDRRLRLVVNRTGKVVSRERLGRCRDRIDAEALTTKLRSEGLLRVRVERDGRRFGVVACEGATRVKMAYDRFGERLAREANGRCGAQDAAQILGTLEERGADKVNLFAEGCFRGSRYRWSFNRLGDRTGRKRVGEC